MDQTQLKQAVKEAQSAVEDITEDSLKKIAFQKILDKLLNNFGNSSSQTENITNKKSLEKPNTIGDISEFIYDNNLKSNTDIVIAIAYYYHYQNNAHFTVNDVIKTYKKVLIPLPKNPTDIINQNIKKGLVSKQDEKIEKRQAYHVTRKGIEYVDNGFDSHDVKKSKSRVGSSSRKRSRKTKSPLTNNILSLIGQGYFDKPKSPNEVKKKLEVEGCFYDRSIVDEKLRRRFLGKELTRIKQQKKWHYVIKKELDEKNEN